MKGETKLRGMKDSFLHLKKKATFFEQLTAFSQEDLTYLLP